MLVLLAPLYSNKVKHFRETFGSILFKMVFSCEVIYVQIIFISGHLLPTGIRYYYNICVCFLMELKLLSFNYNIHFECLLKK